jgi:hypothetical protein
VGSLRAKYPSVSPGVARQNRSGKPFEIRRANTHHVFNPTIKKVNSPVTKVVARIMIFTKVALARKRGSAGLAKLRATRTCAEDDQYGRIQITSNATHQVCM